MVQAICLNGGRIVVVGPSIGHQCVWVYEPSTRTLKAIFASLARESSHSLLPTWLRKAPEAVCHPAVLLLILCEHILNGQITRRMELHSRDMDADAILLGMSPTQPSVEDLDEKHLIKATRSLTVTLGGIAWFISKLDRLEGMIEAVDRLRDICGPHSSSEPAEDRLSIEVLERMAALKSRMAGWRLHAARVQSQGEAMVQTV
jgi:hypothetical protein